MKLREGSLTALLSPSIAAPSRPDNSLTQPLFYLHINFVSKMFRHPRSVIRGDGGRKTKKEVTEDDGMLLWPSAVSFIHLPLSRGSIFSEAEWMCLYSLLTS